MVRPYEMPGRKRKKRKAERYEKEVEEPEQVTAVEAVEEEEAEEGGIGAESTKMKNRELKEMKSVQEGTDLPSYPLVAHGQNSVNRPGDRISKLPDDILVHILSTLEFRESAQTSVLSRRWLNLWTFVPRLHFDATKDQREKDSSVFVNWVNHVLGLHKSSNLREFRIFCRLDKCYQNEIDKWLEYALGKGVERMELNFSEHFRKDIPNEDMYVFPNRILEQIAPQVGFACVRALHFSVVNISGEAIECLLRKCPLLEDLRVIGSILLANLVVSGPSLMLKHLQITGCSHFQSLTISNTNIVSFRVSIGDKGNLLLNDLPMLTQVWIFGQFSIKSVLFSRLSRYLSQLTVLTLQAVFPEAIMELYKFPELKNLRRLALVLPYCIGKSLVGLTSLIDSCPHLEEFALMDRISKLPDDILVDILSTLEFRESAQTSVLSHRWLNLWTLVPRLHFDATKDQREKDRSVFVNWVNHVLGLHKSSNLREFRISGWLDKGYQNEIDKWLVYALGKGVQRLALNFSEHFRKDIPNEDVYVFPNRLLEQIAPQVCFACVRELHFSAVNISGEAIECLLRKCPLLEDLRVISSKVLVNLVVSGPSLLLKHLEISGCSPFESITISDTKIVYFRVSIGDSGNLLLNDLPMLTEVWIFGQLTNKSVLFSRLSRYLSQLTVLTLQALFPEAIMELYKFPELKNLRRLVLVVPYCTGKSLIGLTSLIDSCPSLEEFALRFQPLLVDISDIEQKKATKQSLKGLKVFELHGYSGLYENESEMIMFFIENAVALQKIVIDPRFVTTSHGAEPIKTEHAKGSRRHAIQKFEGVVPKHVELVIL